MVYFSHDNCQKNVAAKIVRNLTNISESDSFLVSGETGSFLNLSFDYISGKEKYENKF